MREDTHAHTHTKRREKEENEENAAFEGGGRRRQRQRRHLLSPGQPLQRGEKGEGGRCPRTEKGGRKKRGTERALSSDLLFRVLEEGGPLCMCSVLLLLVSPLLLLLLDWQVSNSRKGKKKGQLFRGEQAERASTHRNTKKTKEKRGGKSSAS